MTAEKIPESDESLQALRVFLDSKEAAPSAATYRDALESANANLLERFSNGESVSILVNLRSRCVDLVLRRLWAQHATSIAASAALVAVGGYGRGELHPFSDVDIMILVDTDPPPGVSAVVADFFTILWDVGLDIGHSLRSISDCCEQAESDITVATTLLEARLVDGSAALFDELDPALAAREIWPSDRFFSEKLKEQHLRHHRYEDTAYQLEPNVKGSPGGLRDIQMIGWVAQRHFGAKTLEELVPHQFLTAGQLKILKDGREFLWRVRFALHALTGRREDRLLFDHQTRIAAMLGYEDAANTLAVEKLMQRYYRTVMDLSRLNEMLLQLFEEAILLDPLAEPVPINARFQVKNDFLQTTDDTVFSTEPSAMLELFVLLQQHQEIRGVSAYTVALIRQNLHLINEEFRQDSQNHELFLTILRAPAGVTHGLRRMNLYGVLGQYVPSFGRIVGRMQYDLFHAYTVDQHTLFVVSNLRRFALSRFDHEHPHCSPLMQSFEKPEIVYLAGLFHDIAKGRGGDHSELGAVDAEAFCLQHGLSQYEARTVAWLVRQHLVLSMTAQKKDIGDPDVINEFAALVRDQSHLDYLYVLTVADVKGTNPKLWNSWKASLFRDLYEQTSRALRRGLENPIDRELLISETKDDARAALQTLPTKQQAIDEVWNLFTEDYFLRYRSDEIAWHTEALSRSKKDIQAGLLDVRPQTEGDGIEAMFYTPRSNRTFAHATAQLDELRMTIVDVRIVPLANDFSLDTYVFMELDRRTEVDAARLARIRRSLSRVLNCDDQEVTPVARPAPRRVRMFATKTAISFAEDTTNGRTVMELVTGDRPGLLSLVGRLFVELEIDIEAAKILTIGERAEDVFYIADVNESPLAEDACEELRSRLMQGINANTED